jgi:hypothetical protein
MAAKKPKPPSAVTVIRHGGRDLAVPVLSGPVGSESPALKAKYSKLNQPADVALVDYYLSAIEAVKALGPQKSQNDMGLTRLLGVVAKNIPWGDRSAAIRALQTQLPEITDSEEKELGLIKPDIAGPRVGTWRVIVDLGDAAEKLLGDANTPGATKYIHTGIFDRSAFARKYETEFKTGVPQALFQLLAMMEQDAYMIDMRWIAYMLATCSIETKWTFAPVDEDGKGDLGFKKDPHTNKKIPREKKDYYLPVKVQRLPDGRARVTEQDGDQFFITADGGGFRPVGNASRGSKAVVPMSDTYRNDDGAEFRYFGRGYVQLTYWNGYATAGAALHRNLDFLFAPELVKDPATAYKIMSIGMRTGTIFANGQRLAKFICGGHCDYFNARQMVNSLSSAQDVANRAMAFERILLASKYTFLA